LYLPLSHLKDIPQETKFLTRPFFMQLHLQLCLNIRGTRNRGDSILTSVFATNSMRRWQASLTTQYPQLIVSFLVWQSITIWANIFSQPREATLKAKAAYRQCQLCSGIFSKRLFFFSRWA
jgi:hypothetical protein